MMSLWRLWLASCLPLASALGLWHAICHAGLDVDTFQLTAVVESPLYAVAISWTDDTNTSLGMALLYQPSYREVVILDTLFLKFDPWLARTDLKLLANARRRTTCIDICISNYLFCEADTVQQKLVCEPYIMP
jgi:hypothetical protein